MKYKTLAFTISLILSSQMANANPAGGQVVHGSATFSSPSVNVLNVTNSNNAIINWQSFNIGAGQTTNFIQPSAASSVLNRVISNNPSQLLGNLNSNGKVFLINQHGILVGAGAQINTAGFFGSTLNITDNDYLNGNLKFEGDSSAGISNQGYIHAGENGNIVLIAPNIENGGVIEVDNGNVILAAGKSITISSLENPAIQFEVTGSENTVTNLGKILASQGSASLFAGTLNHSGSIRAGGMVQNADGSISLVAKATNRVSGSVDVSGSEGGYIEILGDTVSIAEAADINASGATAGGKILIGGDQQGLNPDIQNASSTSIAAGARVNADATTSGNGGKVIVFAENEVHVHGEVSARGGAVSGDGGFIETSGLKVLDITSVPDASAFNGKGGEWLIDPNNISIINGTGFNVSGVPDFISTDDSAVLDVNLINFALNNGQSVTISTADADADNSSGGVGTEIGDITIQASILKTTGSDASLTLNAHNNINVDSSGTSINITSTSGVMDVVFNADSDSNGSGSVFFDTGTGNSFSSTINTNGGTFVTNTDVTINGDVLNTSSAVYILNTQWDIPFQTALHINEDLVLDAPGTVVQNNGEIVIGDASTFYYPTFNISGDTLNLPTGSLLSGDGTLVGSVDVNGGVIFGGDGDTYFGYLTITDALKINSGALYVVVGASEVLGSSYVAANSISINGGSLILNWQDSTEASIAGGYSGSSIAVAGCSITGCYDTSAAGFDTVVDPIITSAGIFDNGVTDPFNASYTFGSIDTSNILQWTGLSTINPNEWNDSANWVNVISGLAAVPDATSDVFIDGTITPLIDITSAVTVRGLQSHGQINIGAGGSLDIGGNAFILNPTNGDGGLAISAVDALVSRTGTGVLYNLGATLKLDQGTLSADTVNWGEIQTSVGTPFQIDGNLVNNALFAIDANSGTNTFTGTGSIDNKGIMSWGSGASLTLDGVSLTSAITNAQFQGAGVLILDNNAIFAINSSPAFYSNSINWELNNGVITGVNNLSMLPDLIDWYGGTISGLNASTATLGSAQVMNLYGTADMNLTGGFILDNFGTINFLSSAGDLIIDGELVNQFTLNLNHTSNAAGFSGTGVLTNNGTINQVSTNDFVLANSQFALNGDLNINNGNFILQSAADFNQGFLNIATGAFFTVDTGGSLVLNDLFEGISGNGSFVVSNGGILDLNSFVTTSHNKDFTSLAALNINSGVVLNIQDIQLPTSFNISTGAIQGGGTLNIPNTTSFVVDGGSFQGASVSNPLAVNINASLQVLSGQTLTLSDADLTINSLASLSGGGSITIPSNSSLTADGLVTIAHINLLGGTLWANNLNYSGDMIWVSGVIDGGGLTTLGNVDLFSGELNTDWTIGLTGSVNWSSPDYAQLVINNATVTNRGLFTINSYVDLTSQALAGKNFSTSSNASFINNGSLIIDSGISTTTQGPDAVEFDILFSNVGGTIGIKSGTFRIIDSATSALQALTLDAGSSLQGFGTFDGTVINAGGTVSPGRSDVAGGIFQTGTLSITGDFIQQADGNLVIKMDSTSTGLLHDTLNVAGTLNAGGGIKFAVINGKTPVELALLLDQSFTPLTYGSFANKFATVDIPAGLNFTYSGSGAINITSNNQELIDISNQLEVLFNTMELDHRQMVRAMKFVDQRLNIEPDTQEDDEKKRAPRLVCR